MTPKPPKPPLPPTPPAPPIAPISTLSQSTSKIIRVEVAGYYIDHYEHCKQAQTNYCGLEAAGFAAAMRLHGHKAHVIRKDQDASPRQWSAATDKDPGGVDTVEFAYLATHGGTYGKELGRDKRIDQPTDKPSKYLHWFLATFDSPDGCILGTVQLQWVEKTKTLEPQDPENPVTNLRLGEGRLRWVVFDTCRSLQVGLENDSKRNPDYETMEQFDVRTRQLAEVNPGKTWGRCYAGVHILFGFTGLSSDSSWTGDRGTSFGYRAGRGEPLADSWLDEAYSYWVGDVPVATAFGQGAKEADERLRAESLKNVVQTPDTSIDRYIYMFSTMWRS